MSATEPAAEPPAKTSGDPFGFGDEPVDVAVVGAGPAGCVAAAVAAAAGRRTVLLERSELPRYKTCGGGLVGISRDILAGLPAALQRDDATAVTFSCEGRQAFTRRGEKLVALVMRDELDEYLATRAVVAGARLVTGVTLTAIAEVDAVVELTVRRAGETVRLRARTVIGADGTGGRVGGYVGVRAEQVDLGLEGEFPADVRQRRTWAGRLLVDWGPLPGSYGWVFPKGDVLTVGVIGARADADTLRVYYRDFIGRLGLATTEPLRFSGHLTRCRAADSPLRRGRVLVAGDAAGLCDPFSREGISFALRSGRLAGTAAATATARTATGTAATGGDPLEDYAAAVIGQLGPEMAAGRVFLAALSRHRWLLHHCLRLPPGWRMFTRQVRGQTTYAAQLRKRYLRALFATLAVPVR